MASPQCENGYTKIANEILEFMCSFRIPGEVRMIVDAIMRKTYGYNKKEDIIANSQIIKLTGLRKGNVSRALSEAITHKIVIKSDNKLSLNKNTDEWISFKRKVIENATKVIGNDNKKLSETRDTKEKKETIQKKTLLRNGEKSRKQPDPNLQELINHAESLNFVLQGTQQSNRFSAYNMLKKYGLERSKKAVEMAVGVRGKPYAPTINDFTSLYRKIGDLINFYQKEKNERDNRKPIIG